ncbi:MAG TPA: glutathione peroxidase [Gemmatimonadaceae bacterium]|jgi:glutathione peroxidase|nr:glutathione peroxidase [Gemmatimonadaceae bacterium]
MSIYDLEAMRIDGSMETLAAYRGKVLLIVNVASQCGFTPQYEGLQALYQSFHDQGFEVLGFPCDQFGHQEPGPEAEIAAFCSETYGVTFPMFAKVDVNGPNAHPLFQFLKEAQPGVLGTESIKWNFTKFLVGADGRVARRFAPADPPAHIEPDIAARLAEARRPGR